MEIKREEILTDLCYYDARNPECLYDAEDIADHKKKLAENMDTCSCDNCFYGRDILANHILNLLGEKRYHPKFLADMENNNCLRSLKIFRTKIANEIAHYSRIYLENHQEQRRKSRTIIIKNASDRFSFVQNKIDKLEKSRNEKSRR